MKIDPQATQALSLFSLPSNLGFGTVMAPIMIDCMYKNGQWQEPQILPYGPISMAPTCKALHYAQEIFEGLKAYYVDKKGPYLFRPQENAERFNLSAKRMAMPEIPVSMFIEMAQQFAKLCINCIPQKSGESLYIRPFMFASEEGLGIKPSEEFRFMIIASPSGAYFTGDSMRALIERDQVRADPGGTGYAKTGGNYARSLLSAVNAKKIGFNQSLWLDGRERKWIEELSGMNFFSVINGTIVTPKLSDTILKGVTRECVIQLAKEMGIIIEERPIAINQLLEEIQNGTASEAFACGTAAIVTPISCLGEREGQIYNFKNAHAPIGMRLRKKLLDIQEGRELDNHHWRFKIS